MSYHIPLPGKRRRFLVPEIQHGSYPLQLWIFEMSKLPLRSSFPNISHAVGSQFLHALVLLGNSLVQVWTVHDLMVVAACH